MQLLNPALKLNARIPNLYPQQTAICRKEVMLPVTTNASGDFFMKCYPGSRPCFAEMGAVPAQ